MNCKGKKKKAQKVWLQQAEFYPDTFFIKTESLHSKRINLKKIRTIQKSH